MAPNLPAHSQQSPLVTLLVILGVMVLVALVEVVLPLYARTRWNRAHLVPNLTLMSLTFVTNALYNSALVAALWRMKTAGVGPLRTFGLGPVGESVLVLLLLDFSFYAAHVAMHKIPALWRVHRVHHSDPAVDVTTTIRQHPLEGIIRYAFMAVFAIGLGASPGAFAIYRTASALNGLLEHANVRFPAWLARSLVWITTWPGVHQLHHSRLPSETDTNYGNLFSIWDRLFGTFTPPRPGELVSYGLAGYDDTKRQTTLALLLDPFRSVRLRRLEQP